MAGFAAGVSGWAAGTKDRIRAVRNESAQRVVEIMQTPVGAGGNMPVRDGFLRASLVATTGAAPLPNLTKPFEGKPYTYEAGDVALVIARAGMNDAITFAYTANYARAQNYGSRGRAGRLFVELAAQQWGRIVQEIVREVNARAK